MANQSLFSEVMELVRVRKIWWLLPILLSLLALGAIAVFAETSVVAPFVYTLF